MQQEERDEQETKMGFAGRKEQGERCPKVRAAAVNCRAPTASKTQVTFSPPGSDLTT